MLMLCWYLEICGGLFVDLFICTFKVKFFIIHCFGAASFGILNVQEHSKNITLLPSFIIQEYSGVVLITLLHEQDHHRLSKNIVFREHSVSRISPSFAILCILVLFTPISHSLNFPRTYVINEICNVSRILDLIH